MHLWGNSGAVVGTVFGIFQDILPASYAGTDVTAGQGSFFVQYAMCLPSSTSSPAFAQHPDACMVPRCVSKLHVWSFQGRCAQTPYRRTTLTAILFGSGHTKLQLAAEMLYLLLQACEGQECSPTQSPIIPY